MLQRTSHQAGEPSNRSGDTDADRRQICRTDVSPRPDKSVDPWFKDICNELYPKPQKAGATLAFLTGFDERSCQRYAAGQVAPPGYLIRALLQSDHGLQWHRALMHGCTKPWYGELGLALDQIIVSVKAFGALFGR